jgi:hypothetical protein
MTTRCTLAVALLLGCEPAVPDGDGSEAESVHGSEDGAPSCEDETQTAAAFLATNAACTTVVDCQTFDKGCYEGPEVSCTAVAVNQDADVSAWEEILATLEPLCPDACGGNDCGASIQCVSGRCTAVF